LSELRVRNKIKLATGIIAILSLILGILISISATILLINNLPAGTKCITGEVGVAVLGIFITLITTPVIGLIYVLMYNSKHKKQSTI